MEFPPANRHRCPRPKLLVNSRMHHVEVLGLELGLSEERIAELAAHGALYSNRS